MAAYGITPRERDALDFIVAYKRQHDGVAPSYSEIAVAIGTRNKSVVHRLIMALVKRGRLRLIPNSKRTLQVIRTPDTMFSFLRRDINKQLREFCRARGERPEDVISDALALHLDGFTAYGTQVHRASD